jgi:hypothetical protein
VTPKYALGRILDGLDRIADFCGEPDLRVESISLWSAGQHIEHVLRVDDRIRTGLTASSIAQTPRLSFAGRLILLTGHIPRGKGKAVTGTEPTGDYVALRKAVESTARGFRELEPYIDELARMPGAFAHPSLGGMTRRQWLRFADVHQRHHETIVREIRAAAPPVPPGR